MSNAAVCEHHNGESRYQEQRQSWSDGLDTKCLFCVNLYVFEKSIYALICFVTLASVHRQQMEVETDLY